MSTSRNFTVVSQGTNAFTDTIDIKEARGVGIMVNNTTPAKDYKIEVSLEGTVWATTATVTKVTTVPLFVDLTNLTANYVRLAASDDLSIAGANLTVTVVSHYS